MQGQKQFKIVMRGNENLNKGRNNLNCFITKRFKQDSNNIKMFYYENLNKDRNNLKYFIAKI